MLKPTERFINKVTFLTLAGLLYCILLLAIITQGG
jgi:hypothetical protein